MNQPYAPSDARGAALHQGDLVRIVGLPNLGNLPIEDDLQTREVFQHLRGTVKRIRNFNIYGLAQFSFFVSTGPLAGYHSVCIEPWLLLRQRNQRKAQLCAQADRWGEVRFNPPAAGQRRLSTALGAR
jgi:hypothetical protein